ncbi:MAG TPA: hypothetical protein DCZ68_06635, partial [Faecalibacterium sp.]|nr:hypothetical protein [Faecalibacterium sp.]
MAGQQRHHRPDAGRVPHRRHHPPQLLRTGTNIINLFKNVSIRYIIALGISGCLITTGNDLSAGRLAGFAACLACIFAQTEGASGKFYPNMPTLSTPVVFILVIAICAIVGLCNGLVV